MKDSTIDHENHDSDIHTPHTRAGISRRSGQLRFAAPTSCEISTSSEKMSFINPMSLGQSVTIRNGILRLSREAGGDLIDIPVEEVKKVKENFPDIAVTLTGNRIKRIEGRYLSTQIYSNFLHTLKEHAEINHQRNKRLNQS